MHQITFERDVVANIRAGMRREREKTFIRREIAAVLGVYAFFWVALIWMLS